MPKPAVRRLARSIHAAPAYARRVLVAGLLIAGGLVPWSSALVPQFTCPQSASFFKGPDCHCPEENDCAFSITITPLAQPFAWSVCRWNFAYTITCPGGCAGPVSDGDSVTIDCDPHARSSKEIKIACPVGTYDDWVKVTFGCGYCN